MLGVNTLRQFYCVSNQYRIIRRFYTMDDKKPTQIVADSLQGIKTKIEDLSKEYNLKRVPRLVAVSKFKPSSLIKECYDVGHRYFGENYVQELFDKSQELPSDVKWHFIGHLQSNKCKQLLQIKNLEVVETVDRDELAKKLNKYAGELRSSPLKVFVQVNTSGEETKSGVSPDKCEELVSIILNNYKHLEFAGLMTIGEPSPNDPYKDFQILYNCRDNICTKLNLDVNNIELSMGMSSDYDKAMKIGSTNIRVGSSIFGAR